MANTEKDAVCEVVQKYIDGTYQGDVSALRECFHSTAVMNGYLNDQLLLGDPEPFFQEIEKMHFCLIGFYHSHPSESRPSSIDKAKANYYGYSYLIVALHPLNTSSWVLEDNGEFTEEAIQVIKKTREGK